jgi:hemolysin activation/secretion protein
MWAAALSVRCLSGADPKSAAIQPKPGQYAGPDAVHGIVVNVTRQQAEVELTDVNGIRIANDPQFNLLRTPEFNKALAPYFKLPAMQDPTRQGIVDAVRRYYIQHGRPLVEVDAPFLASLRLGVVQVFVLEGRLEAATVKGNRWFKTNLFTQQLHLKTGDVIDQNKLLGDVAWLNRSQFRQVGLTYKAGSSYGQTQVELDVKDRFPLSGIFSFDNSGVKGVGENRVTIGFDWGNAFGWDHRFAYRFNSDTEFERLKAHFASYEIPLPWRDSIRFYGGYAEINVPTTAGVVDGSAYSASGRYDLTLRNIGSVRHQFSAGFDYKNSDTAFRFGTAEPLASRLEVGEIALTYSAGLADFAGTNLLRVDGFYSPGGLFDLDNTANYSRLRPGVEAEFGYARFYFERATRLWSYDRGYAVLDFRINGQAASERLPQSEQLVVGGMNSVRGFREFLVTSDQGYYVNVELLSPPLRILKDINVDRLKNFEDGLRILGFFDYGWANTLRAQASDLFQNETLSSAGFGVRYYASRYLQVRFDYGMQIKRPQVMLPTGRTFIDPDDHRAHISVTLSY